MSTATDYMEAYDFAVQLINEIGGEQASKARARLCQFWRTPQQDRRALSKDIRA